MQPGPQAILQPVLSWGYFGPEWTVSSWLYPDINGQSRPTAPVTVKYGDVLTGVIRLINQGPAGFSYRCEFEGVAQTVLMVRNIPELVYCVVTLEADEEALGNPAPYELSQPTNYPDAKRTRFRRIKVEAGSPIPSLHWRPVNYLAQINNYGEHTAVVSKSSTKGRVDIFYEYRECLWR
jgi:hypothetical protein